jgi:hypothetical protein
MIRIQEAKGKLRLGTPKVVWQFLVFRHNENEIEEARSQYKAWGADELRLAGAQMPVGMRELGFEPSTIPEFNIYHDDHGFQRNTVALSRSRRTCSWLYGTFVLNPNGSVSACCASAAEKDDFSRYSMGMEFFETWNSERHMKARRLVAGYGGLRRDDANRRVSDEVKRRRDGMGSGLALREDEIICERCPIPYEQDAVRRVIRRIALECIGGGSPCLVGYALMGMPHLRECVGRVCRRIGRGVSRRLGRLKLGQIGEGCG